MTERGGNAAPVIIKRRRAPREAPPHGGAWKVAYADFVTAMMAFFLLMWLLSVTSNDQREGISDYFSERVPLIRVPGGGASLLSGETTSSARAGTRQDPGGVSPEGGTPEGGRAADDPGSPAAAAEQRLVEEQLFDRGGESRTMERLLRHVITRVTDEGLVIELFDNENASLFRGETAEPGDETRALARILAEVLDLTGNRIAVNAHVRGRAVVMRSDLPWNLTGARAQTMRLLLEEAGVAPARMERVTGYADRVPAVADPGAIRNNRIEVVLLRANR